MGQADFVSTAHGCSATLFARPYGIGGAFGMLAVADMDNHRVLIWNTAPSGAATSYQAQLPDVVLGQPGFSDGQPNQGAAPTATTLLRPTGVAFVGTSLVVVDSGNA